LRKLKEVRALFLNCFWNPRISEQAHLVNCRFPESEVYISDWVNVCDDNSRKTVDFQVAWRVVDRWAELRDEYTGTRLYIILILVLAFFLPYLIKSAFLISVSRVDAVFLHPDSYVPLWDVLLYGGKKGLIGWIYAILGSMLMLYNVMRLWITLETAKLREREEHLQESGFLVSRPLEKNLVRRICLPSWLRRSGGIEIPLLKVHFWLKILFGISAGSALYRLIDALLVSVPMI